jgi:hypothetical protein
MSIHADCEEEMMNSHVKKAQKMSFSPVEEGPLLSSSSFLWPYLLSPSSVSTSL